AAIKRELADKAEVLERRTIKLLRDGNHSESDRQIEARALFFDIGGREIDRGAAARPVIAAVGNRGGHTVAAFFDRGIRQTDDYNGGNAVRAIHLDFDFVGVDAVDRGRI